MNKNESVVIEKTANGYLVRQEIVDNMMISAESFYVFQSKGDTPLCNKTLFGWLDEHFE